MILGFALSEDGRRQGCMGIDAGDLDGDGREDIVISNFSMDYYAIYMNHPHGFFDVSQEWGLGFSTRPQLGWGTSVFDFDLDQAVVILVLADAGPRIGRGQHRRVLERELM